MIERLLHFFVDSLPKLLVLEVVIRSSFTKIYWKFFKDYDFLSNSASILQNFLNHLKNVLINQLPLLSLRHSRRCKLEINPISLQSRLHQQTLTAP